jgi:hypothetical protein
LTLGHSIKGIQAVYDDREEYRKLVDDALRRLAQEVEKIIEPMKGRKKSNVIEFTA